MAMKLHVSIDEDALARERAGRSHQANQLESTPGRRRRRRSTRQDSK